MKIAALNIGSVALPFFLKKKHTSSITGMSMSDIFCKTEKGTTIKITKMKAFP
jgi:hypothetical protein